MDTVGDVLSHRRHVQRFRQQVATTFARQFQDGVDQPVHLLGRGADEADGLGHFLAHGGDDLGIDHARLFRLIDRLVDDLARLLQFGGVAHHVDQRRAQVVADDIGEALDFLVRAHQVAGAFANLVLQAGVGGVERRASRLNLGHVTPHKPSREQGQNDDQKPRDGVHDHRQNTRPFRRDASVFDPLGFQGVERVHSRAQFVHVALALARAHGLDRLTDPSLLSQRHGALHLRPFAIGEAMNGVDGRLQGRVERRPLIQEGQRRRHVRPRASIGFEKVAASGQQKTPLGRLGVQHGDQGGARRPAHLLSVFDALIH